MKIISCLTAGVSILALAVAASAVGNASAREIYYPAKMGAARIDPNTPLKHIGPYEPPYRAPGKTTSGTWTDVSTALPFTNGPWGPMQLTDGTVIIEDFCTSPTQWYKLTPDSKGNYADGTWSKIAPMPSGYAPLFFAQQVLPDGRVIINGGEYNNCSADWTNKGALYDPLANSWTSVSPPSGWSTIGDAQSIILPDGTYMLANCCDSPGHQALASISGTTVTWTIQKSYDSNDEQGYTPLPDGNVLMVDVRDPGANHNHYEIYDTSAGTWSLAGRTADYLGDEFGAAPLTPEGPAGGTIIQFTGNSSLGVNDVYSVAKGKWRSGPVMTYQNTTYICDDAPAATLPDGNILVQASSSSFETPSHFWEFKIGTKGGVTATQVNDPKQAGGTSPFEGSLVVLPTGQVLWDNSQTRPNEVALYKPKGKPNSAWLPVVANVASTLKVGSTGNAISGINFNGFDLGGAYGDDAQAATNFPLVRITNTGTGDVCFARSHDFSTMGVWTTGTTNAEFDIPGSCQTGSSTLQVIVNGIASTGVSVTLKS
jgi:hypothetical protein